MEADADLSAHLQISLPALSISEVAVLLFFALPLATLLGFFFGRSRRKKVLSDGKTIDQTPGETTLGAILALLGLLLAFSFGNALTLTEARKSDVITEANALGTAFLRTDFLPEPGRTELQEALYEYAKTRITPRDGQLATDETARAFVGKSLRAQSKLWPIMLRATADPVPPPVKSFVASSINDVLDAHLIRIRSISVPVTELTQFIVALAAVASLFVLGNRSGLAGRPLTWRTFLFSALLFAIMMTILDVQRASHGLILVDQSPLVGTIRDMERTLQ